MAQAETSKCEHLFADLNIVYDSSNPKATMECLKRAVALGFDAIAVNVEIMDYDSSCASGNEQSKGNKKKKSGAKPAIPPPPEFLIDRREIAHSRPFKQYSRLTLGLADTSQVHNILKLPTVEKYDILCICPKTDEMFNTIIKKLEVDMITIDMTQRTPWVSRKNLVQMAVERGITFEISYSPALIDSSVRRDCFTNGRDLLRATKGKGLVLTSRASKPIEIRAPFDVANLGILFGMTPEQGRRAISAQGLNLLLHAQSRKTIKGVMNVQNCSSILPQSSQLERLLKIPEFCAEVKVAPTTVDPDAKQNLPKRQKLTYK